MQCSIDYGYVAVVGRVTSCTLLTTGYKVPR
jgi:hypothetical protein